jgi:inosose dehydratase
MNIQIATAPVSWGVLMKDTPNVPPYGQVLDQIAAAGYKGTELGPYGYLPFDVTKLREELARRDLTLVSAFTIFDFCHGAANATVYGEALETAQVLAALGCGHIVLSDTLFVVENRARRAGRVRLEDGLSAAEWDAVANHVNAFARRLCEECGLRSCLHPHVGGYLETAQEIDAVLERTDPAYVGLCFDMAHIAYGGGDPVAVLDKWRDRTWTLHLKECDQRALDQVLAADGDYFDGVRAGVFPELGRGTVDWAAINRILHEMDYTGWGTVEQDILPESGADPLASARRNRAFLRDTMGW